MVDVVDNLYVTYVIKSDKTTEVCLSGRPLFCIFSPQYSLFLPVICPSPATYLHWNLIGTSLKNDYNISMLSIIYTRNASPRIAYQKIY